MQMMCLKAGCELGVEQGTASKALHLQTVLICQKSQQYVGRDTKGQGTNSLGRKGMAVSGNTLEKSQRNPRF